MAKLVNTDNAGRDRLYVTSAGRPLIVRTLSQMEFAPKPFVINPTDASLNVLKHQR